VSVAVATFAIPCRDGGALLRPSIESLLAQTRQDFELLLVDDASTDGSAEVARGVAGARLRVERNARPLGIGATWNRCVSLATTPYVCLAHQDDVYDRSYLERLVAALEQRPDAAAAHCRAWTIDAQGARSLSASERYKDRFWKGHASRARASEYALLLRGNWVIAPTLLWRREALLAAGGFDEGLRFVLDWELLLRILRSGRVLAGVRDRLVGYRRHAGMATLAEERTHNRYREEHAVAETARTQGIAAGLLPAGAAASPAMRNNLLRDALADLARGDRAGCEQKLALGRELEPWLARDPVFVAFTRLARLGRCGRALLALGQRCACLV
jgi:hypothetical protein